MVKLYVKVVIGIVIVSVFASIVGCKRTEIKDKPITVWWGTKQEIVQFLSSPRAEANRWVIQAIQEE